MNTHIATIEPRRQRGFDVKITQGGQSLRYSAIARSSSQAFADAVKRVGAGEAFTVSILSAEVRHGR